MDNLRSLLICVQGKLFKTRIYFSSWIERFLYVYCDVWLYLYLSLTSREINEREKETRRFHSFQLLFYLAATIVRILEQREFDGKIRVAFHDLQRSWPSDCPVNAIRWKNYFTDRTLANPYLRGRNGEKLGGPWISPLIDTLLSANRRDSFPNSIIDASHSASITSERASELKEPIDRGVRERG